MYEAIRNPHIILTDKLKLTLNEQILQKRAVESNFYKRAGRSISPQRFFDIVLHSVSGKGYCSLNSSSIEFIERNKKRVTKQGISNRYSPEAVEFIRLILRDVLSLQVSQIIDAGFLNDFEGLIIKDATRFDLPEQLQSLFKGFGGSCTSESAISIQYEYDLKNLAFKSIELTSANVPDISKASISPGQFNKNDLIIRDQGYFLQESFNELIKSEAFFVSRLNTTAKIYQDEYTNDFISFKELYHQMLRNKIVSKDINIRLGKKDRIPVRMVVQLVSDEIYRKRISTLEANAKKKKWVASEEARYRCRFHVIITNIPPEKMSIAQLFKIYPLRWQIELMFKLWKSGLGIHEVQKMNHNRFLCMLYAKLIYITLTMETISLARRWQFKKTHKILSVIKSFNTLIDKMRILQAVRTIWNKRNEKFIKNMFNLLSENNWLEKRNDRLNFEEIFDLFYCNSDKYDYICGETVGKIINPIAYKQLTSKNAH
ncbi:MAG: IS4 family transposase [Bacteroidales bacterium]